MKFRILTAAIAVALTSLAAQATTINIRHEMVPRYDGQSAAHKDRLSVGNRFANGVGFEVEAKWKSQNEDAYGTETGNGQQANISYLYHINDQWSLKPQYKWESSSSKVGHQFNLTLGYKVNDDWSVAFRHRYHYSNLQKTSNNTNSSNHHYNRWTFSTSYGGIQDWKFGASVDYTFNQESQGPRWKSHQDWFSEVNFTGEYKGFDSGWHPFTEIGFIPYKSGHATYDGSDAYDRWRPRVRVGVKYSF
ncbi:oligogalacturonate-specific porin KdgM family protein [Vibrio nitrifigilis]|uniref:Porin n=1 Tax=Vibrio nitrifigilis TaxID=2789781 RepID=A0ABS0GLP4_9VIBR|nr:oligogalacturonate-specific porin KdgM family protein [Vibrio nitrifigilis]MBF9003230.1 porin [Vibrio nitrifigilis]